MFFNILGSAEGDVGFKIGFKMGPKTDYQIRCILPSIFDCFWLILEPKLGWETNLNSIKNRYHNRSKKGTASKRVWMAPKGRAPHRDSTTQPQRSHSEATTRQLWAPRPPWGRGLGEGEEGLFVCWLVCLLMWSNMPRARGSVNYQVAIAAGELSAAQKWAIQCETMTMN